MSKTIRIRPGNNRAGSAAQRSSVSASQTAPASTPSPSSKSPLDALKVTGVIAFLLLVVVLVGWTWNNLTASRRNFQANAQSLTFTRDALTDTSDPVPTDLFSPENIQRYEAGDGLTLVFRIVNDPRKDYQTTEETCGIEPWKNLNESADGATVTNQARRGQVKAKQVELEGCINRFTNAALSITRTVEIPFDDTDGVDDKRYDYVTNRLAGLEQELASTKDTVWLYVFRLTDEDFLNFRRHEFKPGTSVEEAKRVKDELLEWLLERRKPTRQSSIATGLFNALELNKDRRKRKVIVFTDGMENSPRTVTFYPAVKDSSFFDESRWDQLDSLVTRQLKCPDLKWAEVTWQSPPIPGPHIRAAQNYWRHVLTTLCQVPADKVEMIY